MMDRRAFIGRLALGILAMPHAAPAQPARKVARIGILGVSGMTSDMVGPQPRGAQPNSLLRGLRELGYVYGDAGEIEGAFKAATAARAGALLVFAPALLFGRARQVAELAAKSRLPAMYGLRSYVEAGGLISYGADINDIWRRAAVFVDKILKGAKPADLPVEQPTKFELVVNRRAAKALGLTIPPLILLRADQVIE